MSTLLLPVCGVRKSPEDGKSRQEVVAIAEWVVEGELAILESYCRMNDITANWVAHRKGEPAPAGMSALIRGSSFRPGEEELWIPPRLPFSVVPASESEAKEILHAFAKVVRIMPVVDEPNKERWRRARAERIPARCRRGCSRTPAPLFALSATRSAGPSASMMR